MTQKALCIGGVAHGKLVDVAADNPSVYKHPKRLHSAPRNFAFGGEPNNMGEIVGYDEYVLRFRTNIYSGRGCTRPVYVLRGMLLDEAADYFDALTGWATETKSEGVSWRKPELVPADAVRIVEAYEALRERAVMIMSLPEFKTICFDPDYFCVRAREDSNSLDIEFYYAANDDYVAEDAVRAPAVLFQMSRDAFENYASDERLRVQELRKRREDAEKQAAEVRERAEYERLRVKFEAPQR